MMSICNRLECNDNYAETSESLWKYREVDPNNNIADSK